jgi:hypothetical protein
MLALDRSHGAHQPHAHVHGPAASSSSTNPSRPSMSSASRRSSSHSGQPYDLPPRSRSTPPILPHSTSSFSAGANGGPNIYQQQQQQQQQQMQQWHAHQQQQQQRQQFGGGAGWNPYGSVGAGTPQSQQQQHQQWTQQAMAGLGSPHFFHQQQQQLAAWASVYQQVRPQSPLFVSRIDRQIG